ncbi:MAG: MATE family efflux transporter [Halieaceae bacterium]|jgi:MATE family multidrug resistance protein|nr:MATE family efflux transporter [Halieaceae bacterium]
MSEFARQPVSGNAPEPWRVHATAVLRIGLPLVGSHLAQIAIGVTDTVMLGWYGVPALAAGALGSSLFSLLMLVGSGFAWAVMPLAAAAANRNDDAQLRAVARMGLWLSAAYAVAVLPLMFWSETLLLRGQDPDVAAGAQAYLRILCVGMFPALFAMVAKSYLSALEHTRGILWVTLVAAGGNALANWTLIFGNFGFPELGLDGAALASVLSHGTALGGLLLYSRFSRELRSRAILARIWCPDWSACRQVFRLGWPIGITTLAEAGLFAASAIMVGMLGEGVLAAHGIAMQLASITFMVHLGLSQVATVRAGRAASSGDRADLQRGAVVVLCFSAAFSTLAIGAFLLLPEALTGLFLSSSDARAAQIQPIAITLLALAALFQLADGLQVIVLGLLRGLQDTRVPMLVTTISYWCVGAPASYLLAFGLGFGGPGVWSGLVIGLALAALGLSWRFIRQLQALVPGERAVG